MQGTPDRKWRSHAPLLIAAWILAFGVLPAVLVLAVAPTARAGEGAPGSQPATGPATATHSLALPLVAGGSAANQDAAPAPRTSHAGRFTSYEGSKTCLRCHPQQVGDMHGALHYQWQGATPAVPGSTSGGKLGAINDFCGYPDINWIGQLTNLDGLKVDGGCSVCHAGLGKKPSPTATQEQLENIDCLVCHSETYRRKVEPDGTSFRFVPAPEKMSVPYLQAITDIRRPTRAACLSCHAYSGGGANNKRGDLEPAHADPPSKSFDVHMASKAKGGAGLDCVSCHTTKNHHIAGRGSDMRATDLDVPVTCTNCHPAQPHHDRQLDAHTARVDCKVCHIPAYARIQSTDMVRDFSSAEVDPVKRLYEPKLTRQSNVVPAYGWFNGKSTFYEFATAAAPGSSGRTLMSGPLGDIHDPAAKIEPFKHHLATQAIDPVTQFLIPLKMGLLFQFGNPDQAIRAGAAAVGWPLSQGYAFAGTERYMEINHEVAPAEEALTCTACHDGGTRLDFGALGYTPKTQRNGRPLCASCHEDKSDEWKASELFDKVHEKHVDDKKISCTECHNF